MCLLEAWKSWYAFSKFEIFTTVFYHPKSTSYSLDLVLPNRVSCYRKSTLSCMKSSHMYSPTYKVDVVKSCVQMAGLDDRLCQNIAVGQHLSEPWFASSTSALFIMKSKVCWFKYFSLVQNIIRFIVTLKKLDAYFKMCIEFNNTDILDLCGKHKTHCAQDILDIVLTFQICSDLLAVNQENSCSSRPSHAQVFSPTCKFQPLSNVCRAN